jgi:hypothetical protein
MYLQSVLEIQNVLFLLGFAQPNKYLLIHIYIYIVCKTNCVVITRLIMSEYMLSVSGIKYDALKNAPRVLIGFSAC